MSSRNSSNEVNVEEKRRNSGLSKCTPAGKQLLTDVERNRIKRLVVERVDRLGAIREDVEGVLFELRAQGVDVVGASPEASA